MVRTQNQTDMPSRSDEFVSGLGDHLKSIDPAEYGYDEPFGSMAESPLHFKDDVFNVVDASDRYRSGAHAVTHEQVSPEKLHATQEWIERGMLDAYGTHHDHAPIDVVRYRNADYVMDGHHRASAAMLQGRQIQANVYHWKDPE